jgi:hypothetical protein
MWSSICAGGRREDSPAHVAPPFGLDALESRCVLVEDFGDAPDTEAGTCLGSATPYSSGPDESSAAHAKSGGVQALMENSNDLYRLT